MAFQGFLITRESLSPELNPVGPEMIPILRWPNWMKWSMAL